MIKIYEFEDDFYRRHKDSQDSSDAKDYCISGAESWISSLFSHTRNLVHIWKKNTDGQWVVQLCDRAQDVKNIVKPQYRNTIKEVGSLPKECDHLSRLFIKLAFAIKNDDESEDLVHDGFENGPDHTFIE